MMRSIHIFITVRNTSTRNDSSDLLMDVLYLAVENEPLTVVSEAQAFNSPRKLLKLVFKCPKIPLYTNICVCKYICMKKYRLVLRQ